LLRTLAAPEPIKDWSLTSLKERLIKIGAKVVSHGRYARRAFRRSADAAQGRTIVLRFDRRRPLIRLASTFPAPTSNALNSTNRFRVTLIVVSSSSSRLT
jgi:hypothetical protein